MERKRPGILTAVAVLNIVFGSLGLICSCIYGLGVTVLMTASRNNPNLQWSALADVADLLKSEIPSYLPVEISVALYFVVFSSLLIVAGIGLLYIANWARVLSFIFAISTILTQGAYLVYTFVIVFPALARIQARFGGADAIESRLSQIARVGFISLVIIYAIVLFILLLSPSVSAAFARRNGGDFYSGDEGYDDYRHSPDDYA
jgi:uncharacterized Tic20 family protein